MQYVDLANTELHTEIEITKANGDPVDSDGPDFNESALPIYMIHHTMWSNVIVELNNNVVSFSNTNYMYKAAIETLLSYSHDAKINQLSVIGFTGDEGYFDALHPTKQPAGKDATYLNQGLYRRSGWFLAGSRIIKVSNLQDLFYLTFAIKID